MATPDPASSAPNHAPDGATHGAVAPPPRLAVAWGKLSLWFGRYQRLFAAVAAVALIGLALLVLPDRFGAWAATPVATELSAEEQIVKVQLMTVPLAEREKLLAMPSTWSLLRLDAFEWKVFYSISVSWFLLAFALGHLAPFAMRSSPRPPGPKGSFEAHPWGLVVRDFEPLSYDASLHREYASTSEYRGFIHWYRDVVEKALSIGLIVVFMLFLARAAGYIRAWATGEGWRLTLLPLDISVALALVGFALILDSLVLVSTMTDAPGIGRTLDAVIVALAGFVTMLVEVAPSEHSLVHFSFGEHRYLGSVMALVIGALFLTRWVVRNRNMLEVWGRKPEP